MSKYAPYPPPHLHRLGIWGNYADVQTTMCIQYTIDNVYTINRQQCSRDELLEKARTRTFYLKFYKLFSYDYKRARQRRRQVVRIQSALCEAALHLKKTAMA